ncbi:MAG: hypothetical protein ACT4OS_01595 [Acidimicrobiales bacterium]
MSARPRDYTQADEIHMEPGELHDGTNTVPAYAPGLESALSNVANKNVASLGGSVYDIAMRRIIRDNDTRFLRD